MQNALLVKGHLSLKVFARFPSISSALRAVHKERIKSKPPKFAQKFSIFQCESWYSTHAGSKEAIRIRLHPNKINKDSGIEIPEAWMPMIKKHNNRRAAKSGPL